MPQSKFVVFIMYSNSNIFLIYIHYMHDCKMYSGCIIKVYSTFVIILILVDGFSACDPWEAKRKVHIFNKIKNFM